MRHVGGWGDSRFVLFALAVGGQGGFAWLLLAVTPSTAIYPTGLLASVLSHPRPVIALDVVSSF